jgi:hypothetical protein
MENTNFTSKIPPWTVHVIRSMSALRTCVTRTRVTRTRVTRTRVIRVILAPASLFTQVIVMSNDENVTFQ